MTEPSEEKKERDYVSFSEIHLFEQCPYKHHKRYVLGEKDPHTIYSAFGTAIHSGIEKRWKYNIQNSWITIGKIIVLFCKYYDDDYRPWIKSAFRIFKDFFPWMEENFPGCELYDIEFKLEEPIEGFDRKFLGYIDLILYDPKNDIYHILDLKTAGWGWGTKQVSDTKKLYQVILYKKFFCAKQGIPLQKVKCHYLLLLRNPAKTKERALTLHSVTAGEKKIQNATDWMMDTIDKLKSGSQIKSPATCSFCICSHNKKKKR